MNNLSLPRPRVADGAHELRNQLVFWALEWLISSRPCKNMAKKGDASQHLLTLSSMLTQHFPSEALRPLEQQAAEGVCHANS